MVTIYAVLLTIVYIFHLYHRLRGSGCVIVVISIHLRVLLHNSAMVFLWAVNIKCTAPRTKASCFILLMRVSLCTICLYAQMPGKSVALWKCFSIVNIFPMTANADRQRCYSLNTHSYGTTRRVFESRARSELSDFAWVLLMGKSNLLNQFLLDLHGQLQLKQTRSSCSVFLGCENECQPADTISIVLSFSLTPAVFLHRTTPYTSPRPPISPCK